jgi:hypothetical protein
MSKRESTAEAQRKPRSLASLGMTTLDSIHFSVSEKLGFYLCASVVEVFFPALPTAIPLI